MSGCLGGTFFSGEVVLKFGVVELGSPKQRSSRMRDETAFSRTTWSLALHCFKMTLGFFLKSRKQPKSVRRPRLTSARRSSGLATWATSEGERATMSFRALNVLTWEIMALGASAIKEDAKGANCTIMPRRGFNPK